MLDTLKRLWRNHENLLESVRMRLLDWVNVTRCVYHLAWSGHLTRHNLSGVYQQTLGLRFPLCQVVTTEHLARTLSVLSHSSTLPITQARLDALFESDYRSDRSTAFFERLRDAEQASSQQLLNQKLFDLGLKPYSSLEYFNELLSVLLSENYVTPENLDYLMQDHIINHPRIGHIRRILSRFKPNEISDAIALLRTLNVDEIQSFYVVTTYCQCKNDRLDSERGFSIELSSIINRHGKNIAEIDVYDIQYVPSLAKAIEHYFNVVTRSHLPSDIRESGVKLICQHPHAAEGIAALLYTYGTIQRPLVPSDNELEPNELDNQIADVIQAEGHHNSIGIGLAYLAQHNEIDHFRQHLLDDPAIAEPLAHCLVYIKNAYSRTRRTVNRPNTLSTIREQIPLDELITSTCKLPKSQLGRACEYMNKMVMIMPLDDFTRLCEHHEDALNIVRNLKYLETNPNLKALVADTNEDDFAVAVAYYQHGPDYFETLLLLKDMDLLSYRILEQLGQQYTLSHSVAGLLSYIKFNDFNLTEPYLFDILSNRERHPYREAKRLVTGMQYKYSYVIQSHEAPVSSFGLSFTSYQETIKALTIFGKQANRQAQVKRNANGADSLTPQEQVWQNKNIIRDHLVPHLAGNKLPTVDDWSRLCKEFYCDLEIPSDSDEPGASSAVSSSSTADSHRDSMSQNCQTYSGASR